MDTIFVSYKWAYANRVNETDDRLRVSASGDCGASWTLARIRKGTTNLPTRTGTNLAFTPSGIDQWSGETLTLTNSSYMTENFQLKYEFISYGAGPRAGQFLVLGAKCHALINGKLSPDIDDIQAIAYNVLRHRLVKNYKAEAEGITEEMIINKLM
jgi:hypothetical protein